MIPLVLTPSLYKAHPFDTNHFKLIRLLSSYIAWCNLKKNNLIVLRTQNQNKWLFFLSLKVNWISLCYFINRFKWRIKRYITSFGIIALQYTNRKYLIDVGRGEVFMISGVLYVWITFNLNLFHSSQQGQLSSSLSQKAKFCQSVTCNTCLSDRPHESTKNMTEIYCGQCIVKDVF